MEKLGFEGLAILLILLPGFLCSGLIQLLCVRPSQTEFDKVREALLYSFIIYVIFLGTYGSAAPVSLDLSEKNGVQSYSVHLQPWPVAYLALISIVIAFGVGIVVTNDFSGKAFRKIRASRRTSRSPCGVIRFTNFRDGLKWGAGDGRRVVGWLRYYSDEPEPPSLFFGKGLLGSRG